MNDNLNLDTHISKRYNADLENLREDVLTMGGMVETQLVNSLQSLVSGDVALAKEVIKGDKNVNAKELEIDKRCIEVVALRQPTASDLRLIFAISKTVSDLENIGDLSQHLARMGKKLSDKGYSMRYYAEVEHVGERVVSMLKASLNALARLDVEAAVSAMEIEPQISRETRALVRQISTYMMEDPREIKKTLKLLEATRALQRIGDLCENLCEYTIYLVRGEDVRYQDFDDVRNKIMSDNNEE